MKNIYWLFIALISLASCEAEIEKIHFNDSNAYIAFGMEDDELDEDDKNVFSYEVTHSTTMAQAMTVDFDISTEGIENPAIEGVDFEVLNSSRTLSYSESSYTNAIRIKLIGNDSINVDRQFRIKLVSNSLDIPLGLVDGAKCELLITLKNNDIEIDESHPLAELFGFYVEDDYDLLTEGAPLDPESGNSVTILPDPEDDTQVLIMNIWGINQDVPEDQQVAIIASVDIDNKTMQILPGQVMFSHDEYGACKLVAYNQTTETWDLSLPLTCQIDEDGNITTGVWAPMVSAGYFGVYQTIFRKK